MIHVINYMSRSTLHCKTVLLEDSAQVAANASALSTLKVTGRAVMFSGLHVLGPFPIMISETRSRIIGT